MAEAATRLKESIYHGSIFIALEEKFVTPMEILEYLIKVPVENETNIAYKAVCLILKPDDQYMDDGLHFLTKKPEYALIAVSFGLNEDTPDCKNEDNNPIIVHLVSILENDLKDKNKVMFSNLIVNGSGYPNFVKSYTTTLYRARNFPHIPGLISHNINKCLIGSDWYEKFRYNEKLPILVLDRIIYLQQNAPFYYAHIGHKIYEKVVRKLFKDKLLSQISKEELSQLNNYFPNIIPAEILEYDDLCYKISLLNNDLAGYVLGFPIQNFIPNDQQIALSLKRLREIGEEKYIAEMKVYLRSTYAISIPQTGGNEKYVNDEDVQLEEIDDYSPFDIVAYQAGEYIYRFTRPEFPNLLKEKKNHWTNEYLPLTVLSTIKARVQAVKELGFPPSRTMKEHFEKLKSGTFMMEDQKPTRNQLNNTPFTSFLGGDVITPLNFQQLYYSAWQSYRLTTNNPPRVPPNENYSDLQPSTLND